MSLKVAKVVVASSVAPVAMATLNCRALPSLLLVGARGIERVDVEPDGVVDHRRGEAADGHREVDGRRGVAVGIRTYNA